MRYGVEVRVPLDSGHESQYFESKTESFAIEREDGALFVVIPSGDPIAIFAPGRWVFAKIFEMEES